MAERMMRVWATLNKRGAMVGTFATQEQAKLAAQVWGTRVVRATLTWTTPAKPKRRARKETPNG